MSNDNGKISVRQSLILFLMLFCAPAVRYIPAYAIGKASQAAWLTIIPSFIFGIIYAFAWSGFLKKHDKKSLLDIINEITGKYIGGFIRVVFFLWITLLLAYYLRMYAERILTSTMPNVNIIFLLSIMIITLVHILKSGIIPIAKMAEIFFIIIVALFFIYNLLVLPEIKIDNLLPVTFEDTLPIIEGSAGFVTLFSYISIIFIFNDEIEHKGEFDKMKYSGLLVAMIGGLFFIAMPIAVFGASVSSKLPLPFFATMMQINIFDVVERIESGIIVFWVISEFILMAVFIYSAMHILKKSFKLNNTRPLTMTYIIIIFFLSLILAGSTLELKMLSESVITPLSIIVGYCLPIIIYIIGKIRKIV